MVITGITNALPGKIKALVYLDAFVPVNGQSLVSLIPPGALPPGAADQYTLAPLPAHVIRAYRPEVAALVDATALHSTRRRALLRR